MTTNTNINATELLIVLTGGKYSYRKGDERRNINKRECDKIFKGWQDSGRIIHRKYGMGGKVTWVWPE